VHPEVQLLGRGDDGVDEGHAVCPQRFIVFDKKALNDGREPFAAAHLSGDGDGLEGLLVAVGRDEADGGHQFNGLEHDMGLETEVGISLLLKISISKNNI